MKKKYNFFDAKHKAIPEPKTKTAFEKEIEHLPEMINAKKNEK